MQFLNSKVKDIITKASSLAIKYESSHLTLSHIYYSSITNSKVINDILEKSKVNVNSLRTKILNEIKTLDKVSNYNSNVKKTETVNLMLKICEEEYNERLNLSKQTNISQSKAIIDEATFFNIIFIPTGDVENSFQSDEYHIIQELTLKDSQFKSLSDLITSISDDCCDIINKNYDELYDDLEQKPSQNYSIAGEDKTDHTSQKIDKYADNLNVLYKNKTIDCEVFNRDYETEQVIQILARKKKANPVLVGESGVGKTSIIYNLVKKIEDGNVPEPLKNKIIYSLNLGKLVAGTKYRGDFEARLELIINTLLKNKNIILFVDEIHNIIGAGSASNSQMDASNLLKTHLSNGTIKTIGTTTIKEFKILKSDSAFAGRFQKISVNEQNKETTLQVINKAKHIYEKHHNIKYSDEIIEMIVDLSDRHIKDKFFPDKAFDLMDELGSLYSSKIKKGNTIKPLDVVNLIEKKANIKVYKKDKEKALLKALPKTLSNKIFGQDDAIKALVKSVYIAKTELGNENKPFASFLFLGPTGVGKTESINVLSESLSMKLHRFDMSEYMERHSVSKLFGASPGYVGYESGGQLTEKVKKDPYSIILFDEIEKAHPDVLNSLLQILDNGKMTDSNGEECYFRNTIIILTSNAGVKDSMKSSIGFDDNNKSSFAIDDSTVNSFFSPEFRNRLSGIIKFNYLDDKVVLKVVDKFIGNLSDKLKKKGIDLSINSSAKKLLAETGYDRNMGARPMERIIVDNIMAEISEKILFDNISNIKITVKNKQLNFEYS